MAFDFDNIDNSPTVDIDNMLGHVNQYIANKIRDRFEKYANNNLQLFNTCPAVEYSTEERIITISSKKTVTIANCFPHEYATALYEIIGHMPHSILKEISFIYPFDDNIFNKYRYPRDSDITNIYYIRDKNTITITDIRWLCFMIHLYQTCIYITYYTTKPLKITDSLKIKPFTIRELSEFINTLSIYHFNFDSTEKLNPYEDFRNWRGIKNFIWEQLMHNKIVLPKTINSWNKMKGMPIEQIFNLLLTKTTLKRYI